MTRQERDLEQWLAANAGDRPLAVILGTSWNGLSFARSLGRRRVPVLLLESKRTLGSHTRYGKVLSLPAPDDDPQAWIRILRFVGTRLTDPGVLVPMGDAHTLLVSRHEQALRPWFRFVVPPRQSVEQIVNKRLQYAVAQEAGIPIPRTHFPESAEEVRELSAQLPFPCLLKPYTSHIAQRAVGQKVLIARSAGEVVSGYERLAASDVPAMVQEMVPGEDRALFGYLAVWDSDGRELAWVTKQKLRQHPPRFGDGSLQVTVEAPEVADLSRRLLRAFDYRGFVGVEFKLDAASGTYYLMEINPRTVSGNQMAISAGADFPWIGYRYLTGSGGAEPAGAFRRGVKFVNEELEARTYLERRRSEGMTFGQWARSIRGATSRAVWARDDPLPFVVLLWRLVRLLRSQR
jgi:predicted ATP-grasp superfamily ATP-dependent carboligase